MLKTKLTVLMLTLSVASCSATRGAPPPPDPVCPEQPVKVVTKTKIVDSFCDTISPINVAPTDILADATVNQIMKINQIGVNKCGWKKVAK
ncbi:Rz-like spanin [Burkholderia phage BcepGomr]|uniref:Rz-like spanin n=1 Tax=Burkholderia phage BcepGomr TaxID=437329 RepID=UPI0001503557|nr:Rz-like spanin [Burkholderia phage BcepGomr]ABP63646.1 BcepGomrgp75 [Burkholderia phage BcepGomr]